MFFFYLIKLELNETKNQQQYKPKTTQMFRNKSMSHGEMREEIFRFVNQIKP